MLAINFFRKFAPLSRIACLTILSLVVCAALQAQPGGPPGGGPPPGGPPGEFGMEPPSLPNVNGDLKKLTKLLSLNTDQQTQVKAVLTDERTQLQAAIKKAEKEESADEPGPGSSNPWQTFAAIRHDANSRIAALLNPDQAEKFSAWQKKHGKSEMDMGPDGMPPPPPDGGGPPPGSGGPPGGGPPGM